MWRESVAQLARVRREIERHLAELVDEHLARGLVSGEVAGEELVALADTGVDGPKE